MSQQSLPPTSSSDNGDDDTVAVRVPASFRDRHKSLPSDNKQSLSLSMINQTSLVVVSPTSISSQNGALVPRQSYGHSRHGIADSEERRVRQWLQALRLHVLSCHENGYLLADPYRNGVLLSDLASLLVFHTVAHYDVSIHMNGC
jgi:hypothetical protein